MTNINLPLLAAPKEVITIGIVIGAIFTLLFLPFNILIWMVVYSGISIWR